MGTWQNVSCVPQAIGGREIVQSPAMSNVVDVDLTPIAEAIKEISCAIKSTPCPVVNIDLDRVADSIDLLARDVISVSSAIERIRLKADIPIDRLHVEMPKKWVWTTIAMPPIYGLITWLVLKAMA